MSPLGKSGKHYYSPHEMSRQGDAPDDPASPAPDPAAAPSPDPTAGAGAPPMDAGAGGGQSITITQNPDGTVTCDDGSGQPSVHASMDEALQSLMQPQGDMGQAAPSPAPPQEDLAGSYSK